MSWGVQLSGAATATMLMNLEIVFTLPLAAAVLGEALDARRLLGAALVLTAVAASQWSRRSEL
jgi:drug/metabolite transporter (DMT)-like permease